VRCLLRDIVLEGNIIGWSEPRNEVQMRGHVLENRFGR
jgi:hypothetical protein